MGRRTRELILAATVCGVLIWGLQKPVYRAFVLDPAMRRAVEQGDREALRALALRGADVRLRVPARGGTNLKGDLENGPLWAALRNADRDLLRLLIRYGADVKEPDKWGQTPLMHAASVGDCQMVETLLAAGAPVNARNPQGASALMRAVEDCGSARETEHLKTVRVLLRHGADPHVMVQDFTPLALAETDGLSEIARELRKTGSAGEEACLDRIAAKGPLHAIRSGKFETVKRLVRRKVSFREADEEGTTLTVAAQDYTATYLPYLLKHARGIDRAFLNDRGGGTETPLTAAARIDHWVNVQHLLKAGADPSIPDAWGNTPLHLAAMTGRTSMAQLLLKAGANPNARDNAGRTPLHWAKGSGDKPMEAVLRAAGGTN